MARFNGATSDDVELVAAARLGDAEAADALVERCRGLVYVIAKRYFVRGATFEDVRSEGMYGLTKAIRDFRPEANCSFRGFAALAIERQIITFIKTANRQKHLAFNNATSLDAPLGGDDRVLADTISDENASDLSETMRRDAIRSAIVEVMMQSLTDFEAEALHGRLRDVPYAQIAVDLGRSVKAVDNALQRAHRKLLAGLRESDDLRALLVE